MSFLNHSSRLRPVEALIPSCVILRDGVDRSDVIRIVGEADLGFASQLKETLESVGAAGRPMVLDLSACRYFDSTIISALLWAVKQFGQRFALVIPDDSPLLRILRICELEDALPIEQSILRAARRVQRPA